MTTQFVQWVCGQELLTPAIWSYSLCSIILVMVLVLELKPRQELWIGGNIKYLCFYCGFKCFYKVTIAGSFPSLALYTRRETE
jgi:hypothetical protein